LTFSYKKPGFKTGHDHELYAQSHRKREEGQKKEGRGCPIRPISGRARGKRWDETKARDRFATVGGLIGWR